MGPHLGCAIHDGMRECDCQKEGNQANRELRIGVRESTALRLPVCHRTYAQPIKSNSAFHVSLPHHNAMKSNRPPQIGKDSVASTMANPIKHRKILSS